MLAPGSRLGAYEIVAPLDAGGMGEVYRARDTRLPREVAVKVLAASRVTDPQARLRFDREAAAIAQLSHPRICTLHDKGVDGDRVYLVMELLTGQTLAARLERHRGSSGLPLAEALAVAADVAEALAFAHRHHVVHRDVKPANIMLTGAGTKLLDFGVAQLRGDAVAQDATVTMPTAPQAVVGTLPYMSPEQLDGKADERSDLFALGAVLYEMLSGRRAFPGGTTSTVVAALVNCEPEPISAHRADVPASVERIVRRCLQRDPARRWQSALDLADELRWVLEAPARLAGASAAGAKADATSPGDRRRHRAGVAAGVTALMLVVGAAGFYVGQWSGRGAVVREPYFDDLRLPAGTTFWGGQIAWSATGSQVAIVTQPARAGGAPDPRLWMRRVGADEDWALVAGAGSEIVRYPFWSPDGSSLGYFSSGKLVTVTPPSLVPLPITDAADPRGGVWLDDGTIVFAPGASSDLYAVGPAGRPPRVLIARQGDELAVKFPSRVGPRSFLYWAQMPDGAKSEVRLASLDTPAQPRTVVTSINAAAYDQGMLYFTRDGAVVGQHMDDTGALSGPVTHLPLPVSARAIANTGGRVLAVGGGHLAAESVLPAIQQLAWFDRAGVPITRVGDPAAYGLGMSLAADARRLLVARVNERGSSDIWLMDLDTGASRSVTTLDESTFPVWRVDGQRFAFRALTGSGGNGTVYEQDVSGGPAKRLVSGAYSARPAGWADEGRRFVWFGQDALSQWSLYFTDSARTDNVLRASDTEVRQARVSADGRLLAYVSRQTGVMEVFVQDLRNPRHEPVRVTRGGGEQPQWRADGRELFFLNAGALHVAGVIAEPILRVAVPRRLFALDVQQFDVHPSGDRVLVLDRVSREEPSVRVVRHWASRILN